MTKPCVSVVVPIYKVEKFLRQAVDSILRQTLREIEVILVDDGSPDKCPEICDEYAQKDKRVKVIHQPNRGLGAAYNAGIAAATGEYIGLVEPDDWIEPEMYEVMYKNAKYYDTDATKCGFWEYNSLDSQRNRECKGIWGIVCNEPRGSFKIEDYELLCAYHSSIWSYIYKASFVKKIKFVETNGGAAYVDAPFGFEVLCRAQKLSIVPRSFYHWRLENHGNSVSITDKRVLAMADRFIEAKEILKKTGKYDALKEIFYLHARNANYGHYRAVEYRYKKEYFKKLQQLFADLKEDQDFCWKYLSSKDKRWIEAINHNRFLASDKGQIFKTWRRFVLDVFIRKEGFLVQVCGCQIAGGKFPYRPYWCQWKIGA